jgi:hypothetical protein
LTSFLPNGGRAILDIRKLADYCLNPAHLHGRHKARVFRQALGFERGDAAQLRDRLLEAAGDNVALEVSGDVWGSRWRVAISQQGKRAVVRSIWLI